MQSRSPGGRSRNRIAAVRKAEGLSMDELGARCQPPTTGSVINRIEKGQMGLTLEWLLRISDALGCHPNDLLPDPAPTVTREEQAVVELYRELAEPDQRALRRVADALAKSQDDDGEKANS